MASALLLKWQQLLASMGQLSVQQHSSGGQLAHASGAHQNGAANGSMARSHQSLNRRQARGAATEVLGREGAVGTSEKVELHMYFSLLFLSDSHFSFLTRGLLFISAGWCCPTVV